MNIAKTEIQQYAYTNISKPNKSNLFLRCTYKSRIIGNNLIKRIKNAFKLEVNPI